MLYLRTKLATLTLAAFTLFIPVANAALVEPVLEIGSTGAGDFIASDGTSLTMDGTGTSIITSFGPPLTFIDIPDVDFILTATANGNNGANAYFFNNGSITAGPYINTTFDNLVISDLGSSASFFADLTGGGRIEGAFIISSGTIAGSFTGTNLLAKAGPVVPVPAAVWLFGSGLLGLVGVARRKKTAA